MKPSTWLRQTIADHGGYILQGRMTEEEALTEVERALFATHDSEAHDIVRDFLRRQIKNWLASHRVSPGTDDAGQVDLFPDIPLKVEVAPGRFVAQGFMTRRDWTAAVKQAETKASNAGGHAEAIKRIADKVLPLLTNDDQTTAEVWKPGRVAEGGS